MAIKTNTTSSTLKLLNLPTGYKAGDTWETKTFINGPVRITDAYGYSQLWSDGENLYNSLGDGYVLNGDTWEPVTWVVRTGEYIWTDGTNIYYSSGTNQYIFDKNTKTWTSKTWQGATPIANQIWTDGTNIYLLNGSHYVLNGDTWEAKTWNGLTTDFAPWHIWTDGTNIYYSSGDKQYVLNGDTWEAKTWNGLTSFSGNNVFSDNSNIYACVSSTFYVLQPATDLKPVYKDINGVRTKMTAYQDIDGVRTKISSV